MRKTFEIRGGRQVSLEQFIRTVKGQYNFGNRMQFYLASGGFSELIQLDFKSEKIIGI